jgi:tRNA modification GTPase
MLRHPETGKLVDHVLATQFVAPGSYTGEDTLEVSCHGGPLGPQLVLDACCAAGARVAERGEFTRRAYLNGRIDLIQAEGTLDLIDARSPAMHRAALFQVEHGLSDRIARLRDRLVELQALLVYDIDFPEEDDGPVRPEQVHGLLDIVRADLENLLRLAPEGELLRDGALAVIAGRPNTGKSSLFNSLLGLSRAIVTDVPGTTRDAIEAFLTVDGYPFRLVDTAGIRPEPEFIEGLGIEVARSYLANADLVLLCVEAGRELSPEEETFRLKDNTMLIRTKADLAATDLAAAGQEAGLPVSAMTGEGLAELRGEMLSAAYRGLVESDGAPLVTRERHTRALRNALDHLLAFKSAQNDRLPAEVAVTHLHEAVHEVEGLIGVVTPESILDVVFGSFCVGK